MDLLFICRDAIENSVIANVAMALEAKRRGKDAAVLFTEEALAGLSGRSFTWSRLFLDRPSRITISRGAAELGLPIASERDDRWTDLLRLLSHAQQAGVRLLACPIWSQILHVDGNLPDAIERVDTDEMMAALDTAKVIGSY